MELAERLVRERRARLAAERMLEFKSRELFAANEKLALHARVLSDEVREQRQVVTRARVEAETLKGQNTRFLSDLDRAHTAAVMAERRLRDSIDAIRDGFAVFDAEGRLVVANHAFGLALTGSDPAPGMPYATLLARAADGLVDLADTPAPDWVARMAARIELDPIPPEIVPLRGGRWLRLDDRRARDGDLVTLAVDITAEMRLRAAVEAIPDGFVLFDRDERLVLCNQHYRNLYPAAADAIQPGARFEDILRLGLANGQHSDAVGREEEWLAERLAAHRAGGGPTEQHLSDGRWLRVQDEPTPDGGRVGLRMDITAEREVQAALSLARAAAEAASRAKSAFLANMSHEIRTPMNGVVGMAELLCDTALTEEQRLFAETIRSSGEALLVIINDILDYSKLEAERMALHPEPFDLERMVHEVAILLQPQARAKGIDLAVDFDMFLPTAYVGDPGRIRQVLTNLMGNAVKFTEQGRVLTRVVGVDAGDGQRQLHITVDDTGIGIAPEHIDHIFGEFNQVEGTANRRFEGTGLGLAITRRLIERMGGAVWVDSTPGQGSVFGFRVVLPVAEEALTLRPPQGLSRVLVVDGNLTDRTILDRQLSPFGIAVAQARSGAEAVEAVVQARFDLVLAGQDLPDGDGAGLAARLRAAGHGGPVALLTPTPDDVAHGAVDAVIAKPVLRADLYRQLSLLLPAPALPEATVSPTRPMRVLVAEDNRTNQLVFAKMVRDAGVDVHFANDGVEAVEMWRSLSPDLVFMDISMPRMDGRDATRAIRAAGGRLPILALTAHAMDGDSEGILAAGMDRHLTKPLRRSVILSTLAEFRPRDALPILAGEAA